MALYKKQFFQEFYACNKTAAKAVVWQETMLTLDQLEVIV